LVGLLFAAFLIAGLLVPSERSSVNEVEIEAPPERVWQVMEERSKYAEWQTNLTKVEVIDEKNWVEYPKDSPDPLKFTETRDERPRQMEFAYTMGSSFAGKWSGDATPSASGTHLKTTDSYSADGWLTKILVYMFFDYDKFAKDWNNKLKQRVEQQNR
jgi:uncharacterized membrane protein